MTADRDTAPTIDPYVLAILRKLSRINPSAALDVADLAFLMIRQRADDTNQMHSANISRLLLEMERRALVRRLDGKKPIAWQITEEGRKYV